MKAIYVEAPNELPLTIHRELLFLGGSISGCHNWQIEVVEALKDYPITIINPRRASFDINKKEDTAVQIAWEYRMLRRANTLLFYFSSETVQPVVLYEIGSALERDSQAIVIGCDKEYPRLADVFHQVMLKRPRAPIHDGLKETIRALKNHYEGLLWEERSGKVVDDYDQRKFSF